MRELTEEEKFNLNSLLKLKPQPNKGYFYFVRNRKKFKRSRVFMQLHMGKKLDIWECVHHKNHNRQDDRIENLEVIDLSDHISLHHAGVRGRKYIKKK